MVMNKHDPVVVARAEELAEEMGDATYSTLEALQQWLSTKTPQHLTKSNESLLDDLIASGGIYHE